MFPTSADFRKLAYSVTPYDMVMRQFIPYALIKIIDVNARENSSYVASSKAFYNNFAQLIDDVITRAQGWGTLEDTQFLLNGTFIVMPDDAGQMQREQNGWVSEQLADAAGNFSPAVTLQCSYTSVATTVGRALFFDPTYDCVPVDFDIVYTRTGIEVARDEIRGNTQYTVVSSVRAVRFDQMTLTVYKVSKPYRRIHLLEDVPGVYLEFRDKDIVSMTVAQEVDIYSEEIVTGEADLVVQNTNKFLDILNGEGLNGYLQKHQPIDLYLNLVYPDLHEEPVLIGRWELSQWRADNAQLEAAFTILDPTTRLSRRDYIRGVFEAAPQSLYSLAEKVFQDAKVTSYRIAEELKSIYTSAALPLATHKECLRQIAQAGLCVVVPAADGYIEIKRMSPLIRGENKIKNAGFDTTSGDWQMSNCAASTAYIHTGLNSVLINAGDSSLKQICATVSGHKYYIRFYALPSQELVTLTGSSHLYVGGALATADLRTANLTPLEWTPLSYQWVASATQTDIDLRSNLSAAALYVDSFLLLDLTEMYGAGNEPSQVWCDTNLRFTLDTLLYPPAARKTPDDVLDYSLLYDPPDITLKDPISTVKVSVYDYVEADTDQDLYNAVRTIKGTETFDITFDGPCKSCTISATLESDGSPVEIVSQAVYARAAHLTIRATGAVRIKATGKAVSASSSTFDIGFDVDASLQEDAKEHSIDNSLITSRELAEDVGAYVAYWDSRRNQYEFSWRQNPAVEVLDSLEVHDDFNNNNVILCTQRNLDYVDGALSGDSGGVC